MGGRVERGSPKAVENRSRRFALRQAYTLALSKIHTFEDNLRDR